MKKIFSFILALAFIGLMVAPSFAEHVPNVQSTGATWHSKVLTPDLKGVKYLDEYSTPGNNPYTEVVRVRYGKRLANSPALPSGCVVSWDTESADGVTVSASVSATVMPNFAGVLVTDLLTNDTNDYGQSNWGYMAVKGYCLASVDTSEASTGGSLVFSDAVYGHFATEDTWMLAGAKPTKDIGTLLSDTAADGQMPVWLN